MPFGFLGIDYDQFQSYVLTWAPVVFMALIVFFLSRTLKLVPKTKNAAGHPYRRSAGAIVVTAST